MLPIHFARITYAYTRMGCLNRPIAPAQKRPVRVQIVPYSTRICERLSLEYVQIRVYYNPHTDTRTPGLPESRTRTRVNENAA